MCIVLIQCNTRSTKRGFLHFFNISLQRFVPKICAPYGWTIQKDNTLGLLVFYSTLTCFAETVFFHGDDVGCSRLGLDPIRSTTRNMSFCAAAITTRFIAETLFVSRPDWRAQNKSTRRPRRAAIFRGCGPNGEVWSPPRAGSRPYTFFFFPFLKKSCSYSIACTFFTDSSRKKAIHNAISPPSQRGRADPSAPSSFNAVRRGTIFSLSVLPRGLCLLLS